MTQLAQYNTLKKEAQANTALYNSLYAKVKEQGISAASPSNDLNVVDQARVLTSPTRPNIVLNLVAGFLLALFGGIAVAFLYERFDNRIRTPDEVRNLMGAGSVSVLPMIDTHVGTLEGIKRRLLPRSAATTPGVFAMGDPGTFEGTYIGMVTHNIDTIAHALKADGGTDA
jgi:hypothetical protein